MTFILGGGCIGCPKQDIDQFKKTYEFYPCQWDKWILIESELHRLYSFEGIDNPYVFTRHNETTKEFTVKMTSKDLIDYFNSHVTFGFEGYAKEISCMCQ